MQRRGAVIFLPLLCAPGTSQGGRLPVFSCVRTPGALFMAGYASGPDGTL